MANVQIFHTAHVVSIRGSKIVARFYFNIEFAGPPSVKIKKWISYEVNGIIFIWYNVEESETPWLLPKSPQVESNQLVYHGRNEFYVSCHIQEIPENGADLAHFAAIHYESFIAGTSESKYGFFEKLGSHLWQAR